MLKLLNRPLAPHLSIYTSQFTSIYSIWHRITGVFLIIAVLIFLLLCKISSYTIFYYCFLPGFEINLWLKNTIFLNIILIFSYHLLNGLRHISWDLGFNLLMNTVKNSSEILIFILTIVIIFVLQTIIN